MTLKSGHKVIEFDSEKDEEHKRLFAGIARGMVRLHPGDWFYMRRFLDFADSIYDFEFRPDDTLIMSFPKSGTTWMQEIIWNMKHPSEMDEPPDGISVNTKCPFIEGDVIRNTLKVPLPEDCEVLKHFNKYCPGKDSQKGIYLQICKNTPDPRILKTHLPFSLLHPKLLETSKVVCVVRNPKDVCVSFYYHTRMIKVQYFTGDLDKFVDSFVNDEVFYCPYWNMLEETWTRKHHKNLHIVHYEALKADPVKEISSLNDFLNTNLSEEILQKVARSTTFEVMKTKESFWGTHDKESPYVDKSKGTTLFRKGRVGTWNEELTKEQNRKLDLWIEKNSKHGKNFTFEYSI